MKKPEPIYPYCYIAHDSRESSKKLSDAAKKGLDCLRVPFTDHGLETAACFKYLVGNRALEYTSQDYTDGMVDAYLDFMSLCEEKSSVLPAQDGVPVEYDKSFVVDCANGIGAIRVEEMQKRLRDHMDIVVINRRHAVPSKLNHECGAEFVQRNRLEPMELVQSMPGKVACLDGDGSRLLYLKRNNSRTPVIIEGDKQVALIMQYIKGLVERLDIEESISLFVAVTEYANPSALRFFKKHKIACSTINNLREATNEAKKHTIGATSHANGSCAFHVRSDDLNKALQGKEQHPASRKLKALLKITNPFGSDAIANLLIVEAVLKDKGIGVAQLAGLYRDHPSQRFKAPVDDRRSFKTDYAGTRLVEPIEL